jgi:DNA-binding transcriptional LysR family regulator
MEAGLNARQLEVFRAVMRHGSLTAAAEALHVSQPAISKVLRHFESQIGYRLFDRLGGRLVPTAEAHLLFRDADRIFREIEVLKGLSDRIRDKRLGLLRIAASAPPTFALLPEAIERFRRRNPEILLMLQTLPAEEIGEHILIGNIDLALTISQIPEPQVRCETIGHAEIVALMRRDSPLTELDEVTPQDLADQTLISYSSVPQVGRMLDRLFAGCGCTRSPHIEIMLSIAAAPLVARGLGVALVDGLVPWSDFGQLVTRPFRPRATLEIVLTTSTALPKSRFVREFTRDLQAAIARQAP